MNPQRPTAVLIRSAPRLAPMEFLATAVAFLFVFAIVVGAV